MKLNLGCGGHITEGWVNIDKHRACEHPDCIDTNPDVIADIRSLPYYEDDDIEAIYCGHVLEHLPLDEVVVALREIDRVLRPGGRFCVVGPDYDRAVSDFPEMVSSIWPGSAKGEWDGEAHAWCPTATNTLELVRQVFPNALEIPISEIDPFWPAVSFLEWQFAITTSKER